MTDTPAAHPTLRATLATYWDRFGFAATLTAALAVLVWPVWSVDQLPLQDLPQHLAAARVLAEYNNPATGFADFFELRLLETQYVGLYGLMVALSVAMPLELVVRLLVTAILVGIPLSLAGTLRAVGNSRWLALLALPLLWNVHLLLGFLNFVGGVPFMFWGLTLASRLGRSPRVDLRTAALFVAAALGAFFMHVVPFGLMMIGATLLTMRGGVRQTITRWLVLAGPSALALGWLFLSSAGGSTASSVAGGNSPAWPLSARFRELASWMTDLTPTESGELALAVWGAAIAAAVLAGPSREEPDASRDPQSDRVRLGLLALLTWVFYLVMPLSNDWIWPIAPRFSLLAAWLVIPALPRPTRAGVVTACAGALVATWISAGMVRDAFVAFQDEVGAFDDAVAVLPEGSRVAALIWDRHSAAVRFAPFLHYGARVQFERGGAAMFTFADFPQSPYAFREDNRPPRVPPRWEWEPQRVAPVADLAWYDYVITRGGPGRIARAGSDYEKLYDDGVWRVWRRTRVTP